MGEVYRARDLTFDRDVAIKVLPASFAGDADRLVRFEREAKTLASLNHPHIAQVYGLERSAETSALVMELVDGEDLAARIARSPIRPDDALAIARQIAEALEAAHEASIVHRDLKPANIRIRSDGTVKVLDFGLAKTVVLDERAHGATITSPAMTVHGMILGTAAYMSPEQATGKPVDRRSDIWAFGCVVYEMLTGRRAFDSDSVTETIGAVLHQYPGSGTPVRVSSSGGIEPVWSRRGDELYYFEGRRLMAVPSSRARRSPSSRRRSCSKATTSCSGNHLRTTSPRMAAFS